MLSAPFIWIFVPLVVGISLVLFQHRQRTGVWLATAGSVLLTALALIIPIGEPAFFGRLQFELSDTFTFLGRRVVIDRSDTIILVLVFAGSAFWNGAAALARTPNMFSGLSLISAGLIVAALSIDPFLYAALLIFLVALINLPLLANPDGRVGKGVLRYLVFQTLGMPFILFVGWMVTSLGAGVAQPELALRAFMILSVGFALLLAVFPFHSWVPMLMEETHPYVAAYLLNILALAGLLFFQGLLIRFEWLRDSAEFLGIVRLAGVLMILINGIFAAVERRQTRLLGYAILFDLGYFLIALGLPGVNDRLFIALFLPRILAFVVWGLALARFHQSGGQGSLAGAMRTAPFVAMGILAAYFSTVGFPVFAGFPVKMLILESLTAADPTLLIWAVVGIGCFLLAGLRSLAYLVADEAASLLDKSEQRWLDRALLVGIGLIVWVGLLPGWFLPLYLDLLP